jgi:hypothetical protein
MQLQLLASAPYSLEDAEANDTRQRVLGITYLALFIVTVVAVSIWTYRANANARALGAGDMTFTPGWAVGWYFVPIASLWKPYQAMVEIWRASRNPADWQNETGTPALPRWWLFWIIAGFAGNFALRHSQSASTLDQLTTSTWAYIVTSTAIIASGVLLAGLVRDITAMQTAHAQSPAPVQPPSPGPAPQAHPG